MQQHWAVHVPLIDAPVHFLLMAVVSIVMKCLLSSFRVSVQNALSTLSCVTLMALLLMMRVAFLHCFVHKLWEMHYRQFDINAL